jgi:hypothetical protein
MEIVDVEAPILTVLIEGMTTYYVVIEGAAADAIRVAAMTGQWLEGKRGFGSARVTVTIGETNWQTSVFPHKASGGWFLPVKAAVRKAEGLVEGDMTSISIAL